jgi:hypothetical protein
MKKWESLLSDETTREHDKKVLETANRQLNLRKSSSEIQQSGFDRVWMLFSVRNLGFATALGLGLLGFIFSKRWSPDSSSDLQLTKFSENFSDLIENQEDMDFLSDEEFALIENMQILEEMSEDV